MKKERRDITKMTYEEAIEKVREEHFFNDYDILKLADDEGWTIAHEQARFNWITNDPEILKLKIPYIVFKHDDPDEEPEIYPPLTSVAHIQASKGWITFDPEILSLECRKLDEDEEIDIFANYRLDIVSIYYTVEPGTVLDIILNRDDAKHKFITEVDSETVKSLQPDLQVKIVAELAKEISDTRLNTILFEILKNVLNVKNI